MRCIREGWADGACWYPETAIIPEDPTGESYDTYAAGGDGGTALDYWWSLSQDLSAANAPNKGVASGGELVLKNYSSENVTFNASPVTLNTANGGSFYRYGTVGVGWMNVPDIDILPRDEDHPKRHFTVGMWFDLNNSTEQILFKSNIGGNQGSWRGIDIYAEETSTRISVVLGDHAGAFYRLNSPENSITPTGPHFVVLYCMPSVTLAGTVASLKLYIDGELQTLTYYTGSATTVAWPISASNPSGWTGIALDYSNGDTYGYYPGGYRDEPFFHWGELSAETVAELWCRGSNSCLHGWDMNPAHIVYKALTDTDQGASEPSATLDDTSFRYAAATFFGERLGCSFQWRNEGSILDFLGEVCRHAGAMLSLDPFTGKTLLIPLRDDYVVDYLDHYTEDHCLEVVEWQDAVDGEAVNEVTVVYRQRDGSDGTATWVNRASVQQQGVSHETLQFTGITRRDTALRIAKRECLQRSSNLSKGKLKFNRSAWDKLPGAVFRFSHGPEQIEELVLRVIEIDTGALTNGAITVSVMQDIFSLDDVIGDIGEQDSEWIAPDTTPAAATAQTVMEAPYWQLLGDLGAAETAAQPPGAGYIVPLIGKPTALSTEYNAWARISPNAYAETLTGAAFAPTATLTASLDRSTDSSIALTAPIALDLVEPGWIAVIGTGTAAELCYVGVVDATLAEISIGRGGMDTTPQLHTAGTRVWFLDASALDWPRIPDEFADADAVDVKAQTATGAGLLDITAATAASITLDSRQVRPYPPGNIEINGEAHPTMLEGALTVTWAHRDRVAQGLTLISQYDATNYGPEAGTTYNVFAYDDSDDTLLDSDTAIAGATWSPTIATSCALRIEIESERDGYVSWQRQVRTFAYIATASILTEASDHLLTEAGDYLITET